MKKIFLILLVMVSMVIVGCGTMYMPPSGVAPASLYSSVNYPSMQNSLTRYNFDREDIVVLGPVTVTSSSTNVLGIIAMGNNGYGKLMSEARAKYPDADGLVNIYFDTRYTNFCLFLFTKVESTITATAVKIK